MNGKWIRKTVEDYLSNERTAQKKKKRNDLE